MIYLKLINAFAHKFAFCICQQHDCMSSKEHLKIAYQVFMQCYAFSFYFIKQYSIKVKWINSMTEWKKERLKADLWQYNKSDDFRELPVNDECNMKTSHDLIAYLKKQHNWAVLCNSLLPGELLIS